MKKFAKCFTYFYLHILFLELVYKLFVYNSIQLNDSLFILIFTVIYALWLTLLEIFLPKKIKFPVVLINIIILSLVYIGEGIYAILFNTTFSLYTLSMAKGALEFKSMAKSAVIQNIGMCLVMLIPIFTYILVHKKIEYTLEYKKLPKYIGMFVICYILSLVSLNTDSKDTYSAYKLYYEVHAPNVAVTKLGLMTEFRLDLERFLFGFDDEIKVDTSLKEAVKKDDVKYNEEDINFDFDTDNKEIKELNEYFKNKTPTEQNEYTGIFKNMNLIYILAEGFNEIAVDKELTPTLYKLTHDGLVFKNYYSPIFMSTTGGEFQYSLSLIPTEESLNTWKSGNIYLPYTLGNIFDKDKYTINAYHDWNYNFYKRNITMPEMGFTNFKACKNGLEKEINCKSWPPSDVEMMNATMDEYMTDDHFLTYYITVSGHAEYNFTGNNIAIKNKKYVENLNYSEPIKAYLATQMELDKSLELLINRLKEYNKLDNTVIVVSGDHYPYSLDVDTINERSTYKRDETFEVNHSNLIIYNPKLESKTIDKLTSSVDVLPTILNMFGLDYDSRLLMGSDIFSSSDSLVIFQDYSWITDKGRYNATTGEFTPSKGNKYDKDYINSINNEVQNRVKVSSSVLKNDYYRVLLNNKDRYVCMHK